MFYSKKKMLSKSFDDVECLWMMQSVKLTDGEERVNNLWSFIHLVALPLGLQFSISWRFAVASSVVLLVAITHEDLNWGMATVKIGGTNNYDLYWGND